MSSIAPVVTGLAVGIAFVVIFSMLFALPVPQSFPDKPPPEDALRNIEKIPEVALFLEKYEDHNSTIYIGRSENGTVRFIYEASASIDKDGNGYKETNRRLELVVIYDESGGQPIHDTFDPERVRHMEAHCKEQTKVTPNVGEAFTDVIPAADNEEVRQFIQSSGCFS